jgi:hypothetical protein
MLKVSCLECKSFNCSPTVLENGRGYCMKKQEPTSVLGSCDNATAGENRYNTEFKKLQEKGFGL